MAINKLEEPVTWKGLTVMLLAMVGLNMTIGKAWADQAERVSKAAAESVKAELATVKGDVATYKLATDAGMVEFRKDIQALYLFQVTKQRQPRLEK